MSAASCDPQASLYTRPVFKANGGAGEVDGTESAEAVKKLEQNRSFGLLLGAVCAVFAVLAYRAGRSSDTVWAALAVAFLAVALLAPRVLAPALRGWLKIGHWLSLVVNPLVLAILYVAVFIPFGALLRLRRHDPMGRNYDPAATSYWIARKPGASTAADSLKEQF